MPELPRVRADGGSYPLDAAHAERRRRDERNPRNTGRAGTAGSGLETWGGHGSILLSFKRAARPKGFAGTQKT
jgi:hypothetical protein